MPRRGRANAVEPTVGRIRQLAGARGVRWLSVVQAMPSVLYKFLRPEHAEAMARSGCVRVGTLFAFRGLEKGDPERGDSGEGELLLHSDAGRRVYDSTAELPPVLRTMGIDCGPGGIATEGENGMLFELHGTDMLIYCVSEAFDEASSLSKWGGAAIRITRPSHFFRALDAAVRSEMLRLGRRVGTIDVGRCSYIDRRHNWHGEVPPQWLLKPSRYRHQREVRAAWTVEGTAPLEALILSSPEIAALCEREGSWKTEGTP